MGGVTLFDLQSLPVPTVIESLDFEAIFQEKLNDFLARDSAYTSVVESDPAYKIIEAESYRELLQRQRINDVFRRRLLAFAKGSDLDHLGAFYEVHRMLLDAGDPEAIPPIAPTYEDDSDYLARIRETIMGSSAGGPAEWYKRFARAAHPMVRAVEVDSPVGGAVRVAVLSREGDGAPSSEILEAVRAALASPSVQGLCHTITVQPAELVTVNVVANVKLRTGAGMATIDAMEAALRNAWAGSVVLGFDPSNSWIAAQLQITGVYSVELLEPSISQVITPFQLAVLGAVELNYIGRAS